MPRDLPVYWRFARAGLISLFLILATAPNAAAGLGVGELVQPFSLERLGGGSFRYPLDAERKVVFVNFWASWCPECKIELPELLRISAKYGDRPFALLAVNMDRKREAAQKFLEKQGLNLLVLFDSEQKVINAFAPVGVPASYLIGSDGKVAKVYIGFKRDSIEQYMKDIETLLSMDAEDTPATAQAAEEASPP
jgi:thiol-disulfide isomerase/thioredoxin